MSSLPERNIMQHPDITTVLGGPRALSQSIHSPLDLIEISEKGVTKQSLLRLADYLGLSVGQIAQLLPITERTIQRYSARQRFNPFVSEHILQMAEVAARGVEVFGERDRFLYWMTHPCRPFGLQTPISLLRSRFGAEMLLNELGRIEHGVAS